MIKDKAQTLEARLGLIKHMTEKQVQDVMWANEIEFDEKLISLAEHSLIENACKKRLKEVSHEK